MRRKKEKIVKYIFENPKLRDFCIQENSNKIFNLLLNLYDYGLFNETLKIVEEDKILDKKELIKIIKQRMKSEISKEKYSKSFEWLENQIPRIRYENLSEKLEIKDIKKNKINKI